MDRTEPGSATDDGTRSSPLTSEIELGGGDVELRLNQVTNDWVAADGTAITMSLDGRLLPPNSRFETLGVTLPEGILRDTDLHLQQLPSGSLIRWRTSGLEPCPESPDRNGVEPCPMEWTTFEAVPGEHSAAVDVNVRDLSVNADGSGRVSMQVTLKAFRIKEGLFCCADTVVDVDSTFDSEGRLTTNPWGDFPGSYSCEHESLEAALTAECTANY
jgi:hypothetical protein